jgi:hypothetical protein
MCDVMHSHECGQHDSTEGQNLRLIAFALESKITAKSSS